MSDLEIAHYNMVQRGAKVEALIRREQPELLDVFYTYHNEALAARKFLHESLKHLNKKSEILEVGAGILALSIQLASEGFEITAVEPVEKGFDEISILMTQFRKIAQEEKISLKVLKKPIEECVLTNDFDLIFSINVMEHLRNPQKVILELTKNLKTGGIYRFLCPNYDFPYEPHFGIWMFKRKFQSFYLSQIPLKKTNLTPKSAKEMYESLNFITVRKIKKALSEFPGEVKFNSDASYNAIERFLGDPILRKRHSHFAKVVPFLKYFGFKQMARLIPVSLQPIIDVQIINE
jgi:2-polyprenyl-3-methyl-5-hydroxy-6-metoxy-1,4-benzoquinol methylase